MILFQIRDFPYIRRPAIGAIRRIHARLILMLFVLASVVRLFSRDESARSLLLLAVLTPATLMLLRW